MDGVAVLTGRQRQIVRLVSLGMSNRQIATELHLSEGTVKEYIWRLFQKLSIHNRTELAVWAHHLDSGDSHGI